MKRFLLTLTLVLACVTVSVDAAPKHRNHLGVTASAATDSAHVGIDVYSDTTALSADSVYQAQAGDDVDIEGLDEIVDALKPVAGAGGMVAMLVGMVVAMVTIVGVLLLLLAPIIIIIMLIRNAYKQRSERLRLVEKAMENGQPIPSEICKQMSDDNDRLWKVGIRNTAIGVGLILMFCFWQSGMLMGVGALLACYGIGQLVIVRTTGGRKKNEDQESTDTSSFDEE